MIRETDLARRNMPRLVTPFEIERRSIDTETGRFSGWASTDAIDTWGTIVAPGAFDESIAEHKRAGTMPALLWQHNWNQVLGRVLDLEPRRKPDNGFGIWMDAKFELATQLGREANALIKPDPLPALNGLSVGFEPDWDQVEWREGVLVFLKAHLAEISVVTFPANPGAHIENSFGGCLLDDEQSVALFVRHAATRGVSIETERDLELALRDAGRSRSDAKTISSRFKPKAETAPRDAAGEDGTDTLRKLAAIFS